MDEAGHHNVGPGVRAKHCLVGGDAVCLLGLIVLDGEPEIGGPISGTEKSKMPVASIMAGGGAASGVGAATRVLADTTGAAVVAAVAGATAVVAAGAGAVVASGVAAGAAVDVASSPQAMISARRMRSTPGISAWNFSHPIISETSYSIFIELPVADGRIQLPADGCAFIAHSYAFCQVGLAPQP